MEAINHIELEAMIGRIVRATVQEALKGMQTVAPLTVIAPVAKEDVVAPVEVPHIAVVAPVIDVVAKVDVVTPVAQEDVITPVAPQIVTILPTVARLVVVVAKNIASDYDISENKTITDRQRRSASRQIIENGDAILKIRHIQIEQMAEESFYDGLFMGTDYLKVFKAFVTKIVFTDKLPEVPYRNKVVYAICEAYTKQVGEVPKPEQVSLLANYILADVLRDNRPDKVTLESYPIMNKRQLSFRYDREFTSEHFQLIGDKKSSPGIAKKKVTQEYKSK